MSGRVTVILDRNLLFDLSPWLLERSSPSAGAPCGHGCIVSGRLATRGAEPSSRARNYDRTFQLIRDNPLERFHARRDPQTSKLTSLVVERRAGRALLGAL